MNGQFEHGLENDYWLECKHWATQPWVIWLPIRLPANSCDYRIGIGDEPRGELAGSMPASRKDSWESEIFVDSVLYCPSRSVY